MTILDYKDTTDIMIQFKDAGNSIIHTNYRDFKKGHMKSPYEKTVHGIGYLGYGDYKCTINGIKTKQYQCWEGMFKRCYDSKYHEREPTYKTCIICDEWLNFQGFGKWYDENFYQVLNQKMQLDKDILHKGNKIYAPENCVFVPYNINYLFCKCDAKRGDCVIGVSYNKDRNKYVAQCNNGHGKSRVIAYVNNELDAFTTYKNYKENIINQIANYYQAYIPDNLYESLINYEVEITD